MINPPAINDVPSPFEQELEALINKFSIENGSDTPDFILAHYLVGCLNVFNVTLEARQRWYGAPLLTEYLQSKTDQTASLQEALSEASSALSGAIAVMGDVANLSHAKALIDQHRALPPIDADGAVERTSQ